MGDSPVMQLFMAIERGDCQQMQRLVYPSGRVDVNHGAGRCTPLHFACTFGKRMAVETLLDLGADVNARNYKQDTPLHLACGAKHTAIALMLLEKGADLGLEDADGETALHKGCATGDERILDAILQNDAGAEIRVMALLDAVTRDIPSKMLEKLILHDPKIDVPAEAVIAASSIDTVKILLRCGADVNASLKGEPLLRVAMKKPRFPWDVVPLLLRAGANVNAQSPDGSSPLHVAAENANNTMAAMLLDKRANVNAQRSDGATPFVLACRSRHQGVIDLLLENRADVNVKANDGYYPLHIAFADRNIDLLEKLLVHGARTDVRDRDGNTPLGAACVRDELECSMLSLVMKHGGPLSPTDKKLVRDWAQKKGRNDILSLLGGRH